MTVGTQQWRRRLTATGVIAAAAITPLAASGSQALASGKLCGPPADTVPPQVTSVTFGAQTLDLSTGNKMPVTVDAIDTAANDAASGVDELYVNINGPHGYASKRLKLASGTPVDGVWQGNLKIPSSSHDGTWQLEYVNVEDEAGNYQFYNRDGKNPKSPTDIRLQSGWDTSFTVTGQSPPPPPPTTKKPGKLTDFSTSTTSVNTTNKAKKVKVVAKYATPRPKRVYVSTFQGYGGLARTKAHSGPKPEIVTGRPPAPKTHPAGRFGHAAKGAPAGGGIFYENIRLKEKSNHHYVGHIHVHKWVGNSTADLSVNAEYKKDVDPRYRDYNSEQLAAKGFPSELKITSNVDNTKPTLDTLTFDPTSVDTTAGKQQVTITATATDTDSGVRRIDGNFDLDTGRHYEPGNYVNVHLQRSGDEYTGVASFRECIPSGDWTAEFYVQDKAGNEKRYDTSKLAADGLPSGLTVTSNPGDITSPEIHNATASGQTHMITLDFSEGVVNVSTTTLTVYAHEPAATRYQTPLEVDSIVCSDGTATVDCSGSGGAVTSAQLLVPDVTGGQKYKVWANQDEITSQLTDVAGNPLDWDRGISVTGS